jgi:hypothetical protein
MPEPTFDKISQKVMRELAEANRMIRGAPVHRGGKRRNYPIGGGGGGPKLFTNTDDIFLGPVDITGVQSSGEATRNGVGTVVPDMNGSRIQTVIPPGMQFWAVQHQGEWVAQSGGIFYTEGTIDGDGNLVYPGYTSDDDNIPVELAVAFCDEDELVEGTIVGAMFLGDGFFTGRPGSFGFRVIKDCCPPDPE